MAATTASSPAAADDAPPPSAPAPKLDDVLRAYCSLAPVKDVIPLLRDAFADAASSDDSGGADAWLYPDAQRHIIATLFGAPPCSVFPPPAAHCRKLLARYARELDSACVEYSEELLEALMELKVGGLGGVSHTSHAGSSPGDQEAALLAEAETEALGYASYFVNLPSPASSSSSRIRRDASSAGGGTADTASTPALEGEDTKEAPLGDINIDTVSVRVVLATQFHKLGLRLWNATFALAEFAMSHPEVFEGAHVVELGSGVGLAGILMSRYSGMASLVLTDYLEDVVDNLKHNVTVNARDGDAPTFARLLDWRSVTREALDSSTESAPPQDTLPDNMVGLSQAVSKSASEMNPSWLLNASVFVGSDIVYDEEATKSLVDALQALLLDADGTTREAPPTADYRGLSAASAPPKAAYIACTVRNPDTLRQFEKWLDEAGLVHADVAAATVPRGADRRLRYQIDDTPVLLLRITRP